MRLRYQELLVPIDYFVLAKKLVHVSYRLTNSQLVYCILAYYPALEDFIYRLSLTRSSSSYTSVADVV